MNETRDWVFGLWIEDRGLGLGMGIEDLDWELELGFGIRI